MFCVFGNHAICDRKKNVTSRVKKSDAKSSHSYRLLKKYWKYSIKAGKCLLSRPLISFHIFPFSHRFFSPFRFSARCTHVSVSFFSNFTDVFTWFQLSSIHLFTRFTFINVYLVDSLFFQLLRMKHKRKCAFASFSFNFFDVFFRFRVLDSLELNWSVGKTFRHSSTMHDALMKFEIFNFVNYNIMASLCWKIFNGIFFYVCESRLSRFLMKLILLQNFHLIKNANQVNWWR